MMLSAFLILFSTHALADGMVHALRLVPFGTTWSTRQALLYATALCLFAILLTGIWHWVLILLFSLALAGCRLLVQSLALIPSSTYLSSQIVTVAIVGVTVSVYPTLSLAGPWREHSELILAGCCYLSGVFVTLSIGGAAVARLLHPYAKEVEFNGLKDGGQLIGFLERGLIFLFILSGQPAGIGFLLAAKAVMRFQANAASAKEHEFVFIGTLASFGWAMAATWGTLAVLSIVVPLGIAPETP